MVGCNKCKKWFYTFGGLNIHKSKVHNGNINVPNLIGMGIIRRKLTRKEASQVTKEVMKMDLKDTNSRFTMAILKTIDIVNITRENNK